MSLLAALAFGVIPLCARRRRRSRCTRPAASNTASRGRQRARQLLMGGQVALALVLLVSSGLMVRSFQKLRALDPGFDAGIGADVQHRAARARLSARETRPSRLISAILDRLAALPGVTAVSAAHVPAARRRGCSGNTVRVEGRTYPPGTIPPLAFFRAVAGGYFETMGIRLIRGRTHRPRRRRCAASRSSSSIRRWRTPLSEAGSDRPARRLESAAGATGRAADLTWLTIVGVVANTPTRALAEAPVRAAVPADVAGERTRRCRALWVPTLRP